jgi:transcription antitermination factor NusA-like protein
MMGDSLEDALMSLIMTSSADSSHADGGMDVFTETALYDRETCGRIIGPGGVTIKSIREQSGCKVVVSNESVDGMQTVSLAGSEAQVRAAKEKLSAVVAALHAEGSTGKIESRPVGPPAVVTQLFAKSQVSRLIGPGGATIRRLRDSSRAFIKIDNEDQPPPPGTMEPCQQLRVTGTDAQVQVALALIHEILSSDSGAPKENGEGKHEVVRSVAKDQVRRLIGQGGATIRKLRDTSRAFIKIDNDELPPAAGATAMRQQLRIIGTDVQVATALQLIADILADPPPTNAPVAAAAPAPPSCGVSAPAAAIPSSNISSTSSNGSLSSSYSSANSIPSSDSCTLSAASTVSCTGNSTGTATAADNNSYAVVRMIPKEQARRLIGPGGATIRRLRDASRAFIKIDNDDLPPTPGTNEPCQQLRVTGTEMQVQVALGMIDELLASPLGSELPVSSQRSDLAIGAPTAEAAAPKTELQRVVPKSQVSRLIGPGGATIRRLRDASRAFIKIDNEDQPPVAGTTEPCQQLRVTGTEMQVHLALALINEVLSQAPAPAASQVSGLPILPRRQPLFRYTPQPSRLWVET